jgi:uncharacterized damage-inducible protein DinB
MIYYGAKELAASSRVVRGNTLAIAQDIPEDKYDFKVAPGYRSVAQLLTHIAVAPQFQYQLHATEKRSSFEGVDFPSLMKKLAEEESKSRTKAQIIELLKAEGEQWASFLDGLSEDFLSQKFTMPEGSTPPFKSRFEMLLSIKEHEMHHRGQLMTIERVLGIVPHLTRQREAHMAQTK